MNAVANAVEHLSLAAPFAGGFYAGRILIGGLAHALIFAPKAEGERESNWHRSYSSVDGALSWCDGLANTLAMAEAGSELAQWARSLTIGGLNDWYIPSLDELELGYRAFKPGNEQNAQYGRAGINVSAIPPSYPYTLAEPGQTVHDLFRGDAAEAFAEEIYWSSTQHASDSDYAWGQHFLDGNQSAWVKGSKFRARVVRRSNRCRPC